MVHFRGIIGYLVTPFGPSGAPDLSVLSGLVHRTGGSRHCPLGSTGESAYLSRDEWESVARTTIDATAGRLPVVVGASTLTTRDTADLCRCAEALGADAVMVLPISYWKLTDDEIFQHYQAVSDAIDIPIMAYNNPATAGIDMSPELLHRMFRDIENVTMVKEQRRHPTHAQPASLVPRHPALFQWLQSPGPGGLCRRSGGTAAPNLIGHDVGKMWAAVEANDFESRNLFLDNLKLLSFILEGGLPATIKAGLSLLGKPLWHSPPPLSPLPATKQDTLAELLNISR